MLNIIGLVLLLNLLSPSQSLATSSTFEQKELEFSKNSAWLNYMYYKKKSDGYQSLITNKNYFLDSSKGSTNPLSELQASLYYFRKKLAANDSHPQCQFPGRYILLKQHFKLANAITCPTLSQWWQSYAPTELRIVYASQYMTNPASVFGHAFLLLPSAKQTEGLWLTYNFAADIPIDTSGLGYIWHGLTGGFTGDYSIMPFYQRMFQYGHIENRDLWSYKIKLSSEELRHTLNHLWELVHRADFSYYFMDENCAGVLIRSFSAILPDLHNANNLDFYVHPIEVIKLLDSVGRIGDVIYKPSQFNLMRAKAEKLNSEERELFKDVFDEPSTAHQLNSPRLADAVIEKLSYLSTANNGELPPELKKLERSTYIQRATLPKTTTEKHVPGHLAPHRSHDSSLFGSGLSAIDDDFVFDLSYRFTIHELLDPDPGFLANSSVELFHLELSIQDDDVWFKNFQIVNVETYQPLLSYAPKASWRVDMGFKENLFTSELTDTHFYTDLGYGLGTHFNKQTFYLLAIAKLNAGSNTAESGQNIGLESGAIFTYKKIKAFGLFNFTHNMFENSDNRMLNASTGFRWTLKRNLTLIQKNQWSRLTDKKKEAHRLSLGLRLNY